MSAIRYRLLTDERESADYKRGLGLGLLCIMISIWFHLVGFVIWQSLDREAVNDFYFSLQNEAPPLELTLVMNEPIQVEEVEAGPGAADEAPPVEDADPAVGAETETAPEEGAMVAEPAEAPDDLATGEILSAAESAAAGVDPDPPISVEGEAPERRSYYTAIRRAVNTRWIMPPDARHQFRPGRLTVDFTIGREGTLLRMVVIQSTGNPSLDHAGFEAIRSAAPFPPLPEELQKFSQLDIRMHFDYKAHYVSSGEMKSTAELGVATR